MFRILQSRRLRWRNGRRRSQSGPDGGRSSDSRPGLWWRQASGTVCLLSELYILDIMSNWSRHKGKVNNVKRSAGQKDSALFQPLFFFFI